MDKKFNTKEPQMKNSQTSKVTQTSDKVRFLQPSKNK